MVVLQQETTPWYKQNWFIILTLIFISPLGTLLMWIFSKWKIWVKVLVTSFVVFSLLVNLVIIITISEYSKSISQNRNDDSLTTEVSEKNAKNDEKKVNNEPMKENSNKNNNLTREQNAALNNAKDYAELMHMSKLGIYEQLTSEYGEKFKPEDAQYAIDHLKFDYNKNALMKAKEYAKDTNMSKRAIYDQLVSQNGEKFTESESKYAIDHLEQ